MDLRTRSTIILAVVFAVLAIALIAWGIIHSSRSTQYKNGVLGINRVNKLLGKFCSMHRYKLLTNVTLNNGKSTAHVDHVVIGYFGVLLFQNVQQRGEYFGDNSLDYWNIIDENGEKKQIASPFSEAVKSEEVLNSMLAHAGIYNVPVEAYVILSGDPEKTMYNGRKNSQILNIASLKKLLTNSKYEKDNQLDIEKIAALISGCAK
ncbi:MAG: NERD domain-containing protein [Oscillospiraceae bacterium]|nr:NERD domain-containing protein [Oscillospiraceae bacterium]